MKNIAFKMMACVALLGPVCVFSWSPGVKNLSYSGETIDCSISYAVCQPDSFKLAPGQEKRVDAKGCLMTELSVVDNKGVRGISYKSSGQSTYQDFVIIGPVNGQLMAGRIE